jgi:aminotransferase
LIERIGIGAVPGSAFFSGGGKGQNLLRFCFAFHQEGLEEAGRRLRTLRRA